MVRPVADKPLVSVGILTLGRSIAPEVAEQNVRNMGLPRKDVEVFIFQNGPAAEPVSWRRVGADRIILSPRNLGIAKGINEMFRTMNGQYLCMIDDDIAYDVDWLGELHNIYSCLETCRAVKPGCGSIHCNPMETKFYTPKQIIHTPKGPVCCRPTACTFGIRFMSRAVYEDVGLFREDYGLYGFEDVDYQERLCVGGYTNFNLPDHVGHNRGEEANDGAVLKQDKSNNVKRYLSQFTAAQKYYIATGNYRWPPERNNAPRSAA